MLIRTFRRCTLALAASAFAIAVLMAEPATAQLFFDWGGGNEKPNDSGRIVGRLEGDAKPGEIIVSFGDRRLYHVTTAGQAVSYPIAIPREQDRWQGKTTVTQKRENPSWTPTPTMIKENPKLPRWVPGGHPMNPLGVRALYLGSSFYRIHGTDAPWTIGTAVSKGCIRMYNKDAQDLYEQVKVGARVLVTWNTYKFTPNPGQPQLPEQKVEQVAAAGTPAQVSTVQAQTVQAVQAVQVTEAPSEQPARVIPAQFTNPFESGPEYIPSRKGRAERAEEAVASETPPANAPAQGTRQNRPKQNAKAEGEGRPRANRSDAQIETGSLGERRQQSAARTKATPAAVRPSESVNAEAGEPTSLAAPAVAPAAVSAVTSAPAVAAAPAAAAADTSAADNGAREIAAKALAAAERAAAAAERAAAAAERAERASAARAAPPAPAAD
jgi:lipoprotein-anchoring transpeptidase ErfK/SrfK